MELFRYSLKSMFKRKLLWISYMVLTLFVHVVHIQQLQFVEQNGYAAFLWGTQEYGLIYFAFFAFFAYEYFNEALNVSLMETLEAYYPKGLIFHIWQLVILFALVLFLSATLMGYQLAAWVLMGIGDLRVLGHAVRSVLLNHMLVMVLGALVGAAVSFFSNRTLAYGVITASVLLVSPLLAEVAKVFSGLFDIYQFTDLFAVLQPDLEWMPDTIYGLAMENCRWNLILFWICTAGAFVAFRWGGKRKRSGMALCLALLVCGGIQFYGATRIDTDSVVRKDHRKDGTLSSDRNYWENHDSKTAAASFEVLSYAMTLDIDRCLEADVTVAVTPSTDGDIYKFTLWYGYEIDSVTDGEGNVLPFTRNGVYVEVTYDCPGSSGLICFRYSGNGNQYYSNDQGIALPGYIPYYPMAGFLDMWADKQGAVIVHTDLPEKNYTVTINSELPLITNLEQTGHHTYSGTASTVSVFGGFLEMAEKDGYTYMQTIMEPQEIDFTLLEEMVGTNLSDKVIMFLPNTVTASTRSNDENSYILFEDHIIFCDYSGYWVTVTVS